MFAEQMSTQQASWKTITRWSAYLEELHARIAHRFVRPEVRQRAYRYLRWAARRAQAQELLADGRSHRGGEAKRGPTPP